MINTTLFELDNVPRGLEGLTAELFADLYDLVSKFGKVGPKGQTRRVRSPEGVKEINVLVTVPPSPYRHFVISEAAIAGRVVVGSDRHCFLLKDGYHSAVLWDKNVTVDDVKALIASTDAIMRQRRFFDEAGERMRVTSDSSEPKISVEASFAKPRAKIIIRDIDDPAAIPSLFDHPNDVAWKPIVGNAFMVFHARDRRYFDRQQEVTVEVLARLGISEADLSKQPKRVLQRISALVLKEMKKSFN